MITFRNWRAVGRAMRWARQQEGVKVKPPTRGILIRSRIYRGPADAIVQVNTIPGSTWFKTYTGVTASTNVNPENAAEALRVLAALELIPAEIAHAPEERYGRCKRCDRLAQWSPPSELWPGRWFHVKRVRFDQDPHPAEVAE